MNTRNAHEQALDEVLRDVDTFANWVYAECLMQPDVSEDACRRLAAGLAIRGVPPSATPDWRVADFLCVMLTDPDPAVVMAARGVLRQRYAADKSERVMSIVWDAQDEAEARIAPKWPEQVESWSAHPEDLPRIVAALEAKP